MAFDSLTYGIWGISFVLTLAGIKYITQPQFRLIRWMLAFCALRDVVLFIVHRNTQAYWDIGWYSKQIELIWLAFIAGSLASASAGRFERPFRIPAFGVAVLSLLNSPYRATGAAMEDYHWHCQIIILATVLIGCLFSIERKNLEIAGSVALLGASGLVSAVSYVTGNYSPRVAASIWAVGLFVLLAAAKESTVSSCTPRSHCATSSGG